MRRIRPCARRLPDTVRATHAGGGPRQPSILSNRRPPFDSRQGTQHISDARLTRDVVRNRNVPNSKAPSDAVVFCVIA
jgi:hypothetical protein